MKLLDLYCGAGAAADGYAACGFEIVGVDLNPQPNYPYAFIQADALSLDPRFVDFFDAIHASPPCQRDTIMRHAKGAKGDAHLDLIPPTLAMLKESGRPWVLENVESPYTRAKLPGAVCLCGSMFELEAHGYQLQRHRLFATSFTMVAPACRHRQPVIGIYGSHVRCRAASAGGRRTRDFEGYDKPALAHEAMGILNRRMTFGELSEAIPPAYTRYVGRWLRGQIPGSGYKMGFR